MISRVFLSPILSPYDQHRWPFKCSGQIIQLQWIQHDINININIMTRPVSVCFDLKVKPFNFHLYSTVPISISWPDQYPCALKVKSFNFHGYSTAGTYLHLSDQYYKAGSCHHHCDGHGYDHYIFQLPFHFCQLLCKFTVCETKLHVQQVCIRREEGYCKIGWIQTSDTDSFKLSRPSTNYKVYFLYF